MNVGLFHYSYPPVVGGVEFVLQGQARQFARHGHRVRIVVARGGIREPGIRICRIPQAAPDRPALCSALRELARGKASGRFERLVARLVRAIRPRLRGLDLALVHNVMTMPFDLALTAALWRLAEETAGRIRWVFWTHDLAAINPDYRFARPNLFPWALLGTRHPTAGYAAVSELRRRQLARLYGLDACDIPVVPNGIDLPALLDIDPAVWRFALGQKLAQRDPVLLFPTRVVRRKNLEYAVRLCAALKRSGKRVSLWITGSADPHNMASRAYEREIRLLIGKLGIRREAIFISDRLKVNFPRLRSLYRICDALLMTSRQEGFGLPVLEAGAHSKPLILPDSAPLNELAEKDAIYFKFRDPPGVTARRVIRELAQRKESRLFKRVMRQSGWESVWSNHLRKWVRKT